MDDHPQGTMQTRVDDMGRLRLPTVFESFLCERTPLIVVYREGERLGVYPQENWKASGGMGLTGSTGIDGGGRIFLAKDLREKAKLSGTVWLHWRKDHLVIMSDAEDQDLRDRVIEGC